MPQLANGVTKTAKSIWRSPDGSREIYEVVIDFDGNALKAKTYSKDISKVGWTGDVEAYEKEGRNGSETFVKQPQKEQSSYGGGGGNRSDKASYHPRDDSHIKAQWAIGQAMTVHATGGSVNIEDVEALAHELFAMVDRVKLGSEVQTQGEDMVHEVNEEPMDLSSLDEIMGKTSMADGEQPWHRN